MKYHTIIVTLRYLNEELGQSGLSSVTFLYFIVNR